VFLIHDVESDYWVAVEHDPAEGPGYVVREIAGLEYDDDCDAWPDGYSAPEPTLGINDDFPPKARVFRNAKACRKDRYHIEGVNMHPELLDSGNDYRQWRARAVLNSLSRPAAAALATRIAMRFSCVCEENGSVGTVVRELWANATKAVPELGRARRPAAPVIVKLAMHGRDVLMHCRSILTSINRHAAGNFTRDGRVEIGARLYDCIIEVDACFEPKDGRESIREALYADISAAARSCDISEVDPSERGPFGHLWSSETPPWWWDALRSLMPRARVS
jgi:hypothetical protein